MHDQARNHAILSSSYTAGKNMHTDTSHMDRHVHILLYIQAEYIPSAYVDFVPRQYRSLRHQQQHVCQCFLTGWFILDGLALKSAT